MSESSSPDNTRPSRAGWLAWWRSLSALGQLWLAAALLLVLLLGQQFLGWPVKRWVTLKPVSAEHEIPGIRQFRLRSDREGEPWNTAFLRVEARGQPLHVRTSLQHLQSTTAPGFTVRRRNIYVRFPDEIGAPAGAGSEMIRVQLPWLAPEFVVWLLAGGVIGFSWYLSRRPDAPLGAISHRFCALNGYLGYALIMIFIVARGYRSDFSFPAIGDDTPEYLKPAVQFANGGALYATADRPFGCPLIYGLALWGANDLSAIIELQKWATFAVVVMLGGIMSQVGGWLFAQPGLRFLSTALGVAAAAAFAHNENIVEREWAVLPEGWAAFYLGVAVVLIWFMTAQKMARFKVLLLYTALCVTTWMMCFTKPNWGLAVALTPLPLIVIDACRTGTWRGALRGGLIGVGIFALVSAAALGLQLHLTPPGRSAGLEMRSKVLFCWHAPMIRREIARRLDAHADDSRRAALEDLERVIDDALARAKEVGPGVYVKLGYDADWILYVRLKQAEAFGALPREERIGLCRELFFSALRREPMTYVKKVAVQFSNYFLRPYGTYANFDIGPAFIRRDQIIEAMDRSQRFISPAPGWLPELITDRLQNSLAKARPQIEGDWPDAYRYGVSLHDSIVFEYLRRAFLWAVFVPIGICAGAALTPKWRRNVDWRKMAPALCVAVWAIGAASLSALSSSIAQALEIQRYIDLYMPLTLLSEILWPVLGLALLLALPRRTPVEESDAPK